MVHLKQEVDGRDLRIVILDERNVAISRRNHEIVSINNRFTYVDSNSI